jgi:transcriptional regulator with PAS, ATPase and Fis domain
VIDIRHLPPSLGDEPASRSRTLEDTELVALQEALASHRGNRRSLALALGLSERTLYRKLRKLAGKRPVNPS